MPAGLSALAAAGQGHFPVAGGILLAAVIIAGFLVSYRISLWRRPFHLCARCRGTGKIKGSVFVWARAACTKCGGTGLCPRLGTHLLDMTARRRARRALRAAGGEAGEPQAGLPPPGWDPEQGWPPPDWPPEQGWDPDRRW